MKSKGVLVELSKRIDFIVGPTGVGKNRLALAVCQKLAASIINGDSVQFYEGVHIGANKPSASDRSLCPHYLLDWVPIGQNATAADFVVAAHAVLDKQISAHYLIVGGSGFYLRALEKGMFEISEPSEGVQAQIQAWCREGGDSHLYERLLELDPAAKSLLHANDHYRVRRALEIVLSTGKSLHQVQSEKKKDTKDPLSGFLKRKVGLWLERDRLRQLVKERTRNMLKGGLLAETQELLEKAGADWSPLGSIGYAEAVGCLHGKLSESELEDKIVQSTMRLAKKQMTWFRRDSEIVWFHGEKQFAAAQEYLYKLA